MRGKKAKAMRRKVTGNPDFEGRTFANRNNQSTYLVHPNSVRGQYKMAKKEGRWR